MTFEQCLLAMGATFIAFISFLAGQASSRRVDEHFGALGHFLTGEARHVLEEAEDLDGPELRNAVRRALQHLRGVR